VSHAGVPDLHVLVVRHLVPYEKVRVHSAAHVKYLNHHQAAGIFLASGQADDPDDGGAILAHGVTRAELASVIAEDPYVRYGVSAYHVITIRPRPEVVCGTALSVAPRETGEG
jgi:uncharacterized protein YciI